MNSKNRGLHAAILVLFLVSLHPTFGLAADWKKVNEENGIIGYTRPTSKSPIDEVKAVGLINAPVQVVEAIIRDPKAQQEFMYKCKEARLINTPEFKSTKDVIYGYNVTEMPFPVKSRDTVARMEFSLDKATGTLYMHSENVKTGYLSNSKYVRMPYVTLDYKLVPKGPSQTEFTYLAVADPGGSLPTFLVNMLSKDLGVKTIANIRGFVTRDKYKNTPAVITSTPVKTHPLKTN